MTFKSTSPEKFKATLQAAKRGWEGKVINWAIGHLAEPKNVLKTVIVVGACDFGVSN